MGVATAANPESVSTAPDSEVRFVRVRFYATFRSRVGGKYAEIEVPAAATMQSLLDAVLERFPELRPLLLDEDGALSRQAHLFVNGRGVIHLRDGMQTPLQEDDWIDFFPAVAGG